MTRSIRLAALLVSVVGATCADAYAGSVRTIDTRNAYLFQRDVHPVTFASAIGGNRGARQPSLTNPFVLIIGVPDTSAFAASSDPAPAAPSARSGATAGELQSFLGVTDRNAASLDRWAVARLLEYGMSNTAIGLFVYELTNARMTRSRSLAINAHGDPPIGAFAFAFDEIVKRKDSSKADEPVAARDPVSPTR